MRLIAATIISFLLACGLIWLATIAVVHAADGEVPVSYFLDPIRPYLAEIASIAVAAFVAWIARRVHALTGLNIEARHREALQSALENGARLVFDRVTRGADGKAIPVGNAVLETGVEYVLRSVPDAVRYFGLTPQRVGELLRPKLLPLPQRPDDLPDHILAPAS